MDCHFADKERAVGYATGTLIRKVVCSRGPLIGDRTCSVQLPLREVFQAPVVQAAKGDIDRMSSEHWINSVSVTGGSVLSLGYPL